MANRQLCLSVRFGVDKCEGLLQSEGKIENKEFFIRHAENAIEVLSEEEPNNSDYQKYLARASGFLDTAEKTTKLYTRGKEILINLGAIIGSSGIT